MNKVILRPAVKLMGALRYKSKFLLILSCFLVPMLVLSVMFLKELSEASSITRQEQRGVEYLQMLNNVQKEVTNHRGMQVALLHGGSNFRHKITAKRGEIDQLFGVLVELDKKHRVQLGLDMRAEALLQAWVDVKKSNATSTAEVYAAHQKLMDDFKAVNRAVSLAAQLVLDPEISGYLLTSLSFNRLPALSANITELRRISSESAFSRTLTPENSTRLSVAKEALLVNLDALEFELHVAYQADAHIRTQLEANGLATLTAARNYLHYLDRELTAKTLTLDTEQTFNEGSLALDKIWALDVALDPVLSNTFESRLKQQQIQEWMAYSLTMLVLLVSIYLFIGFYWVVQQAIAQITDGAQRVADGKLDTRIKIAAQDEMVSIAESFNTMAAELAARALRDEQDKQAEAYRAAELVAHLAALRTHIEQVASGDLSKRILVSGNDDLANLGRNLNTMTERLAQVTAGTGIAINSIYSAVGELQHAIVGQSSGASEQAAAVNETTAALDQIKGMAAQAMERAQVLGETAERSRRESEQGSTAVEQASVGMMGILQRMDGIAQTILALSEQTQQIGEITAVVTNLAQQSKMLALNAAIEAAKAGEAGKGFAVVAAEVRELAEQSQHATAQVQKILQNIRHATDRAVTATEEGSKGVDAGILSVRRTGEVMQKLSTVVRETAMVSQQISAVVKQQFIGLEQVTNAMKDINKVTTQFVINTQQSRTFSADIAQVADKLRDSISVYKL